MKITKQMVRSYHEQANAALKNQIEYDFPKLFKEQPVYEWQWLVKRADDTFGLTICYYLECEIPNNYKLTIKRIEETKRLKK